MAQNDINIRVSVDTSQAEKSTINYRQRVRELKDEMTALQLAGKENTAEYAAAAAELGKITDAMSDTSAQARILSDDFFKQRAAMEGLSVGINVFSGLTQAAALCGIENEDLQETLVKLQAAQNLANTAMNISKALNKDTALMVALRDIKEKLLTKTIQSETKSQLALNAAKAGAIGVIVALTSAVVALGVAYMKSRNSVETMNRELNKQATEAVADTVIEVRNLKEGWDALGDSLEDRKKYLEQNAEALEKLGLNFKDVNEVEQFFRDNTEKYIEAQTQRAKAAAAMEMIVEQQKKQLQNENDMNRMLSEEASWLDKLIVSVNGGEEAIRKMNEGLDSGINKNIKNLQNLKKAAEDTAATIEQTIPGYETPEQKAERQKQEKEKEEAAKKAAAAAQKAIEDRKRAEEDLNNFIKQHDKEKLDREKSLNSETHEGRLKNIEIERQETTKLFDQRIEDAKKLFGNESEQVKQLEQLKIDSLTNIENKRLEEIQNELDAQKEIADKKKEADAKTAQEELEAEKKKQKTLADIKIIGLEEGSAAWLEAYREQLNAELELELANTKLTEEEKALIKAEYAQKMADAQKAVDDKANEEAIAAFEARFSAMESIVSNFSNLTNTLMDMELSKVEGNKRKEEQVRKKYAKMNFASQVASIGIDTAKGIMSVWSTAGELGPIAGPIAGAIQSAMIAALGIAQTAAAKSAMDKALSGKAARGAFVTGRSHSQGGELWELEGGEAVLNKNAMSIPAFRNLASAMNEATGGVSFSSKTMQGSSPVLAASVSDEAIAKIVAGIAAIPVVVTEHDITTAQRNVSVIEQRARF